MYSQGGNKHVLVSYSVTCRPHTTLCQTAEVSVDRDGELKDGGGENGMRIGEDIDCCVMNADL